MNNLDEGEKELCDYQMMWDCRLHSRPEDCGLSLKLGPGN